MDKNKLLSDCLTAYQQSNFEALEQFASELNRHYPQCVRCNVLLGLIFRSLSKLGRSKVFFQKALLIEPQNRFHWIFLTSVLCELENYNSAEDIVNKSKINYSDQYLSKELSIILDTYRSDKQCSASILFNGSHYSLTPSLNLYASDWKIFTKSFERSGRSASGSSILKSRNNNSQAKVLGGGVLPSTRKSLPKELIQELTELRKAGKYHVVLERCDAILAEFPESEIILNFKGDAFTQTGSFELAADTYSKFVEVNPKSTIALFNLAQSFQRLKKLEKAIEHYKKVLELDDADFESLFNAAKCMFEVGNLTESFSYLTQASSLRGDDEQLHLYLALVLLSLGNERESTLSFNNAIAVSPDILATYVKYVDFLVNIGSFNTALAVLDKAEESTVDKVSILLCRSNVLASAKKQNEALVALELAYDLEPTNELVQQNILISLRNLGRFSEALDLLDKIAKAGPITLPIRCQLAHVVREAGDFQQAILHYRECLEQDEFHHEARFWLAMTLQDLTLHEEAAAQFDFLIDNSTATSWRHRAFSYRAKSIFELADPIRLAASVAAASANDIVSPLIGSIILRAEARDGLSERNTFCGTPFDFVDASIIQDAAIIDGFKDGATNALKYFSNNHRRQGLIEEGFQTPGNILNSTQFFPQNVLDWLHKSINSYKDSRLSSSEGLIKYWPERYDLNGWLVSYSKGGLIKPHIHETGWISGSVYIEVPQATEGTEEGNLILSQFQSEDKISCKHNQELTIDVRESLFCLFPSSLLHYTIPFKAKGRRLVLAFDVRPLV